MKNSNLDKLEFIAKALGPFKDEAVFVGGTVCCLYYSDSGAPAPRKTVDVDLTIDITTRTAWFRFEENMHKIGFNPDTSEDAPICRKVYQGIKVDFMPTEESVINLKSTWFKKGFSSAIIKHLPGGTEIKVLQLPYFIASKFEAFFERKLSESGEPDYRASKDFEDIVTIFAYTDISEVIPESKELRDAIRHYFTEVLKKSNLDEMIRGHINPKEPEYLANKVLKLFSDLSLILY